MPLHTPLLFLDIDGVLNSADYLRRNPGAFDGRKLAQMLDPAAVARLTAIGEATQMDTVISSSWRIAFPLASIAEALGEHGFRGAIIGATSTSRRAMRGLEIQAWLDTEGPRCDRFCILDDDSDMEHLMPRLVKTTWDLGLQDEHVVSAVGLLLT